MANSRRHLSIRSRAKRIPQTVIKTTLDRCGRIDALLNIARAAISSAES
jgi:hypothetical protein